MKKQIFSGLSSLLIFSVVVFAGERDYTNLTFARLSYISGNTYVQRAADLGYEEGIVNMPIAEGDRVGTTDGRAEIHLGSGIYLRMDHQTKVDFLDLPKRGSDLTRLQHWAGHAYLRINHWDRDQPLELHTSDVSLYILERGLYRIDVHENRETEILVFEGMAEAAGEGSSALLKSGQRIEAVQGYLPAKPSPFNTTALDGFDRWSGYRDELLRRRLARTYLPYELEDYETELYEYGRWSYISPFGYVWVPRNMDYSWRPYYHGRWVWYPLSGWTWIPYEPWGWVTCHYGRWHWRLDMGWYWIPTTTWGPGWVSWHVGRDYYGWAPLTYYGRPAVIINNHFYADYSEPSYPHHSRALTVVAKNQLSARDVSHVAVSKDSLSASTRIRMSHGAPDPGQAAKRVSVQPLEKNKMFLRVTRDAAAGSGKEVRSGNSDSLRRIRTPAGDRSSAEGDQKTKQTGRSGSSINKIYESVTKPPRSSSRKSTAEKPSRTSTAEKSRSTRASTTEKSKSSRSKSQTNSTKKSSGVSSNRKSPEKSVRTSAAKSSVKKSSASSSKKSGPTKSSRTSGRRVKKKKK